MSTQRLRTFSQTLGRVSLVTALALPQGGWTQNQVEPLRRCLQDFDGIEWRLPYRPVIHIQACASPSGSVNSGDPLPAGRRRLELIGELTLQSDADHLPGGDKEAALHNAVFVHFDALFRQRGYQRLAVEHGDAQVRRYPESRQASKVAQRKSAEAIDRERRLVDALPTIPYVNHARYVRKQGDQDVTLTYRQQYANTWVVMIEGLAPPSQEPGGAR